MITKKLFIQTLTNLMVQISEDKKNGELISEAFGGGEFYPMYDNAKLIASIIDLLAISFDKEELLHYCFTLNFGKIGTEENHESFSALYHRLKKKK